MENIIRDWKGYLYGMWLGGSLGTFYDTNIFELRFWLVLIPTCALVTIFHQTKES